MADEHYCQIHHCKFYRNEKNGKVWYSHKIKDGEGYCNEPKVEGGEAQPKPETNPPIVMGSPSQPEPVTIPLKQELSRDEQIERAVWVKEMGECIRTGAINKETPAGLAMMVWYYTEMRRVLGMNVGKEVNVKQKQTLVEQAKKQGAVEVNEEGG